jgi:ribosomal protein S18 acetylase RimI-like enzyme
MPTAQNLQPEIVMRPMREDDIGAVFLIELDSFADPWSVVAFATELKHNPIGRYQVLCVNENSQARHPEFAGVLSLPYGKAQDQDQDLPSHPTECAAQNPKPPTQPDASPNNEHPIIAAYCCAWLHDGVYQLLKLAVAPPWRRFGFAAQLLEAELRSAYAAGARQLLLEMRADNQAAVQFYSRLGLEVLDRIACYYQRPTCDALVMSMELEDSRFGM